MTARTMSPWLVRMARAGLILAAAAVLFLAGRRQQAANVAPTVSLAEVQLLFPAAARIGKFDQSRRAHEVLGEGGVLLGHVLTTSPDADELVGYSGPSNLLVALSPEQKIHAVRLLASRDTPAHVEQVRGDREFWEQFRGRDYSQAKEMEKVEGIGGSTLTSLAMAEGVERRLSGKTVSYRFPEALTVKEVKGVFGEAATIEVDKSPAGWLAIKDSAGKVLGYAVRTSPVADNLIGYKGPTEVWAAVDREKKKLLAVRLRKSYDTEEYVDRVHEDSQFLEQLAGRSPDDWATIDFQAAGIEGVSGATQTSFAVAEGLRQKFAADLAVSSNEPITWRPKLRDFGMFALIAGALAMCFTSLKGNRRVRLLWQCALIAGFGLWLGDLLSIALVNGWAKNGIAWQTAPGLVTLVAVALIVPWTTKKQIYCHHLCPHGAAQELLGRFRGLHIKLPDKLSRGLHAIPLLLLGFAFAASVFTIRLDLSQLEPFDAWALKFATLVPALIAVVSLAVSLFVPMAYCRYGCPTGALLKLVKSHGVEKFHWRDALALTIILGGLAFVLRPESTAANQEIAAATAKELSGRAFGTTWHVKLRTPVAVSLEQELAAEIERIESTLSHWRPNSQTSQFNSSRTTLAMELPEELLQLVAFGQKLSEASDGAYDLTIAPLADAWGFGPSGPQPEPTDEQIQALLQSVGWQRLEVDLADKTLRKKKPGLKLDLGSLLQGYAADRLGQSLEERGLTEYLVEVGGEIKVRGTWNIAIENPADESQPLRILQLTDAALATSGTYRKAGHILDPRTGRPVAAKWQLVAVVRPTCLEADGWATALLASSERATEVADNNAIAALFHSAGQTETSAAAKREFRDAPGAHPAKP